MMIYRPLKSIPSLVFILFIGMMLLGFTNTSIQAAWDENSPIKIENPDGSIIERSLTANFFGAGSS